MLCFVNGLLRFPKRRLGEFCRQCSITRRQFVSTGVLQQRQRRIATYVSCHLSESSVDEIEETIKEAQGSGLSKADSDLLKFALMGNLVGVQQALAAGANAVVKDKEGRTALHLAAAIGVPSICETVLQAAGDLAKDCLDSKDHLGLTPLHMAAGYCRISTVEYLLSWKPDVNIRNQDGYRPIDLVAKLLEREPKKTLFIINNERHSVLKEIYDMLKLYSE